MVFAKISYDVWLPLIDSSLFFKRTKDGRQKGQLIAETDVLVVPHGSC